MGLWKRIKRLLPVGALAAATAFFIATKPIIYADPRMSEQEFRKRQQEEYVRNVLAFGSGTMLTLAGLAGAGVLCRRKKNGQSVFQQAVEHPISASGFSSIAYGLTYAYTLPEPLYMARAGVLGGALTYALLSFFSTTKPPYVANSLRRFADVIRYIATNDIQEKQHLIEKMRAYYANPSMADVEITDLLFKQEKVDEALDVMKRTVPNSDAIGTNSIIRYLSAPIAAFILTNPFERMYNALRQGDLGDALDALDTFVHEDPSPNRFAARAYVTQSLNDMLPLLKKIVPKKERESISLENRAQHAWQDSIKVMLADPQREQQFKLMGESRNEVLEYAPNKFLQGLLVFKRCDSKDGPRLCNERENMLALRKRFGSRIAQSLAYIEHEGKAYHVLRHGTSRTLEDVLAHGTSEDRLGRLQDAAAFLQELHQASYPCPEPVLSEGHYAERLQQIFYGQLKNRQLQVPAALAGLLPGLGQRVQSELAGTPIGWYKDANPGNWLVEDDGKIVAIDFEHRIRLPVLLDLVSMLEFAQAPAREWEREVVLAQYRAALGTDRESWAHAYKWAALQRHLELAGYRASDQKFEAVQFHLGRAIKYAGEVGEAAVSEALAQIRFSEP